jgi:hypothetical protein
MALARKIEIWESDHSVRPVDGTERSLDGFHNRAGSRTLFRIHVSNRKIAQSKIEWAGAEGFSRARLFKASNAIIAIMTQMRPVSEKMWRTSIHGELCFLRGFAVMVDTAEVVSWVTDEAKRHVR